MAFNNSSLLPIFSSVTLKLLGRDNRLHVSEMRGRPIFFSKILGVFVLVFDDMGVLRRIELVILEIGVLDVFDAILEIGVLDFLDDIGVLA